MKKIFLALSLTIATSLTVWAQNGQSFGKKFKAEEAFAVTELSRRMGDKQEMNDVVVSGTITEVCQVAGCWVKLKNDAGEDVFVKFQDGKIAIPKNMAGRKAVVHGTALRKTISVEDQRHFAEDAGKTAEEIAQIKQPKTQLRINSNGVVVY